MTSHRMNRRKKNSLRTGGFRGLPLPPIRRISAAALPQAFLRAGAICTAHAPSRALGECVGRLPRRGHSPMAPKKRKRRMQELHSPFFLWLSRPQNRGQSSPSMTSSSKTGLDALKLYRGVKISTTSAVGSMASKISSILRYAMGDSSRVDSLTDVE